MAKNLSLEHVMDTFPGLKSEYIRRFDELGDGRLGYDKLLHFVWSAALCLRYSCIISMRLMTF